ncbi:MAG: alcohol dehydrogenase catalytic domain-containing protein [Ruminococcus sp.]|nr:alcohol dehydrogenase catalytic domain-containing protein [Ruminococcus sp.]
MRAAKLISPGKIRVVDEIPVPAPRQGEAVVKVKAVGICGTDLHIFKEGRADVELPRVMGHELSGVVTALGEGTDNLAVGDRVVLDPVMACGSCRICRAGHGNVCADVKCFGVQMDGGFQDEIVVPSANLYRYPESYSFVQAALAEPFSVAANILSRVSVKVRDFVVIMGAGTIGLSLVQGAKAAGAAVLVSDIEESKLEKAKAMGADYTVNSRKEDLTELVKKHTEIGADVVIDAVGTVKLTEQSIELAAPCGRIAVISFDARPAQIPAAAITKKELSLMGSRMNAHRFPDVIQWMRDGALDLDVMISKVYPVEEIQKAFEDTLADSSNTIKTIITF